MLKKWIVSAMMLALCAAMVCGCTAQPNANDNSAPNQGQEQNAANGQDTQTPTDEDPAPLPGEDMLGEWFDSSSQRASMTVTREGEGFAVVIRWSNSAFETNEWRMTGVFEDVENGRIVSDDCALYRVTYSEDGTPTEELIYDGGSAHITYVNGMLYWFDAQEDMGDTCMFERVAEK